MPLDDERSLDRQVLGEVYTSQWAYDTLRDLCDTIGARFAGTDGERAAARLIQDRLRESGLRDVAGEPFRYTGWVRGREALDVLSPRAARLRSLALPYCPAGTIEAELRWVGDGEAEDYAAAGAATGALRGAFVMTAAEATARVPGRPVSHRREKYMRAVEAGAAAFLYVNQNPGDMPITGGLPGGGKGPAPIPGLGLTFETGEQLRRWLERGRVRLRLHVEASFREVESANVVAEIPADPESPTRHEVVLCGGHYDSHDLCEGAIDNGAGVVVAMEAARALAAVARARGRGFARTLRFVFFAAEEIGLLGSWEYVRRHAAELDAARFFLNLDTAGRGPAGSEALAVTNVPELVPFFTEGTRGIGYPIPVRDRFSSSSDHFPFAMNGVPTGNVGSTQPSAAGGLVGRGWGHTPADTFDKADARGLQSAAAITARLLTLVAEAPDWPARRRTRSEMEQLLRDAGELADLELSGRWPPPR